MIGQPVVRNGKVFGYESRDKNFHWFFGNANASVSDLGVLFPDYQFRFLKQVHGNDLVAASVNGPTADAHYSQTPGEALVIQTADCMPVLLGTGSYVIAIHAGWRGVAQEIVSRCCEFLKNHNAEILQAAVGPHIQASEFEVGNDVAEQLLAVFKKIAPDSPLPVLPHPDSSKKKINLAQIVTQQIRAVSGPLTPVLVARESTLSNPEFHSFRRGKAPDARQYSFIARI